MENFKGLRLGNEQSKKGHRDKRYRKYRSKIDILYNILGILLSSEHGVRKTRLLQLANLNSRSYAKYVDVAVKAGLVREIEGVLSITSRGRTIFKILEFTMSILSPESRAKAPKDLCKNAEEELDASCITEIGYYDLVVKVENNVFGVVFTPCEDKTCASLIAGLLLGSTSTSTRLSRFKLLLLLPQKTLIAPERLDWFAVETWIAGVDSGSESIATIIKEIIRESRKKGVPGIC